MSTAGWVVTGTIISGILLLIIGVPLIFRWVRGQTPFIILVSLDLYKIPPGKKRQWTKKVILGLGDNVATIAVVPREGTSWDKINCRLVTRRFSPRFTRIWEYNDADMNAVQVSELEDIVYREHGQEWDYPYFESEEDTVGGYWGIYSPALPVIGGNLAWYYVYIRANDMWEGYLSFRGVLGNKRAHSRIKVEVKMPEVFDKDGKVMKINKKRFHKLLNKASQPRMKGEIHETGR